MKKYKLKNGLQVILTPQKETKAVTVLVLVGAGSRYEDKNIAGISHFLEHMMFKGTEKRPNTFVLSKELDSVGADFNAYTAKDHTGYWIKINNEHIDLALDMLSDMIFNSKLEEKELNREKGTIIEEINMYDDTPMMWADVLMEEIIFKNSGLAHDQLGTKKNIRAMSKNKMINYKNKYYFPKNMLISVAGNFETNNIKNLIDKYFNGLTKISQRAKVVKLGKIKFKQDKPQINLKYKNTEQIHLAFGFPAFGHKDKELLPANLLSVILGGSMSSRLFINVRERQGLCYYINSSLNVYQDIGNLSIRAGLDKERIIQAIKLILKELNKIKNKGITNAELKKAKEYIKGKMILNLEDSSSVAEWYGKQQFLIDKTKTPEQKIAEIMKISKIDVDKVAKKIFQTKSINLALIGPFTSENDFLKILKI
ncbi:MAG: pitrilysin family protein [Patescibacteria group bacterium]